MPFPLIRVQSCLQGLMFVFPGRQGRRNTFLNLRSAFRQTGRGQKTFLVSSSQLLSAQKNPFSKVAYFGVAYLVTLYQQCPKIEAALSVWLSEWQELGAELLTACNWHVIWARTEFSHSKPMRLSELLVTTAYLSLYWLIHPKCQLSFPCLKSVFMHWNKLAEFQLTFYIFKLYIFKTMFKLLTSYHFYKLINFVNISQFCFWLMSHWLVNLITIPKCLSH